VRRGLADLGVTKERFRDVGRFRAKTAHFLVADINKDSLNDLGVVREEIECSSYAQHPIAWYVFREGAWRLDTAYSDTWPREWSELPLLGVTMTPVDFVGYLTWHSYDPASWRSGQEAMQKVPPKFMPRYRKRLVQRAADRRKL